MRPTHRRAPSRQRDRVHHSPLPELSARGSVWSGLTKVPDSLVKPITEYSSSGSSVGLKASMTVSFSPGVDLSPVDPGHHRLERHVAARVRLRVEEQLDVAHVVPRRPLEVRPRQVVEVLHVLEHVRALVIDVEEALEVVEVVRLA